MSSEVPLKTLIEKARNEAAPKKQHALPMTPGQCWNMLRRVTLETVLSNPTTKTVNHHLDHFEGYTTDILTNICELARLEGIQASWIIDSEDEDLFLLQFRF